MDEQSPGYPWDDRRPPSPLFEEREKELLRQIEEFKKEERRKNSIRCNLCTDCVHIQTYKEIIESNRTEFEKKYNHLYNELLEVLSENIKLKKQIDPNYSPIKKLKSND